MMYTTIQKQIAVLILGAALSACGQFDGSSSAGSAQEQGPTLSVAVTDVGVRTIGNQDEIDLAKED